MRLKTGENCASRDPLGLTRWNASYGAVRLAASGEIDICNAHRFREAIQGVLRDPGTRQLTLDFADLDYIDSSGVAAVIAGLRLSRQRGTGFSVINPHGEVLRVLTILGLTQAMALSGRRSA